METRKQLREQIKRREHKIKNLFESGNIKKPVPIKDMLLWHMTPLMRKFIREIRCDCFSKYRNITVNCVNPNCRLKDVKTLGVYVFGHVEYKNEENNSFVLNIDLNDSRPVDFAPRS
jgi:hypothetical protein